MSLQLLTCPNVNLARKTMSAHYVAWHCPVFSWNSRITMAGTINICQPKRNVHIRIHIVIVYYSCTDILTVQLHSYCIAMTRCRSIWGWDFHMLGADHSFNLCTSHEEACILKVNNAISYCLLTLVTLNVSVEDDSAEWHSPAMHIVQTVQTSVPRCIMLGMCQSSTLVPLLVFSGVQSWPDSSADGLREITCNLSACLYLVTFLWRSYDICRRYLASSSLLSSAIRALFPKWRSFNAI